MGVNGLAAAERAAVRPYAERSLRNEVSCYSRGG